MSASFRDIPIEGAQDLVRALAAYFGNPTFPAAPQPDLGHHVQYAPVGDPNSVGIVKTHHIQITWNTADSDPDWYGIVADLADWLARNEGTDFPRRVDVVVKHTYDDPQSEIPHLQAVMGGQLVVVPNADRRPLDKFAVLIGVYDTRPAATSSEGV